MEEYVTTEQHLYTSLNWEYTNAAGTSSIYGDSWDHEIVLDKRVAVRHLADNLRPSRRDVGSDPAQIVIDLLQNVTLRASGERERVETRASLLHTPTHPWSANRTARVP